MSGGPVVRVGTTFRDGSSHRCRRRQQQGQDRVLVVKHPNVGGFRYTRVDVVFQLMYV